MKLRSIYILAFSIVLLLASCRKKTEDIQPPPPPSLTDNDPLLYGNPTNAQASESFPENYLKDNLFYKLAYSRSRAIPVWVAWHLQSEDIGSTPRQDDFRPDTQLPVGWFQVQSNSYSGSGFDRGHNCPSADRTVSIDANSATFLMTNMIPQAPRLNQGPWAALEDHIRSLVGSTKEAFVFMGNYGQGGVNSNNLAVTTISNGNITVPAMVWKVAVILPKGNNDLVRIDTTATIIAVNMPNDNTLYGAANGGNNAWRNYITTITSLEQQANANSVPLNLLQALTVSTSGYLKSKRFQ